MANKQALALLVDDSRVARLTLNKLLLSHGFNVIEQDSAEAALHWLNLQSELPAVIFMDLMMPGMDGITATRTIKANTTWQSIPVVICTGNDSELDKSKAADSGAIAVLAKPPAPEAVNQILSHLPDKVSAAPMAVAPVAIDEAALLNKLQQQLELQWLPQLRAQITAQSEQQKAALDNMQLSLLPDLKRELQQTFDAALTDLRQQAASDDHGLKQQTASMLEQAFQGFDVIGQWQSRLQEQAHDWLTQQQLHAQDALQQNLSPFIDAKIEQQFASELSSALNAQLETALAQQNAALTSQLQNQRAEIDKLQKRNITLAWAAIGIALAALIISVL